MKHPQPCPCPPAPLIAPRTIAWNVETTNPQPLRADIRRGETVFFIASLRHLGQPLALQDGAEAVFYWKPRRAEKWHNAPARASRAGDLFATWAPNLDGGAKGYEFYIGLLLPGGVSYAAHGDITMRDSPGFVPPLMPWGSVDAERVTLENPDAWPYAPKAHLDDPAAHGGPFAQLGPDGVLQMDAENIPANLSDLPSEELPTPGGIGSPSRVGGWLQALVNGYKYLAWLVSEKTSTADVLNEIDSHDQKEHAHTTAFSTHNMDPNVHLPAISKELDYHNKDASTHPGKADRDPATGKLAFSQLPNTVTDVAVGNPMVIDVSIGRFFYMPSPISNFNPDANVSIVGFKVFADTQCSDFVIFIPAQQTPISFGGGTLHPHLKWLVPPPQTPISAGKNIIVHGYVIKEKVYLKVEV